MPLGSITRPSVMLIVVLIVIGIALAPSAAPAADPGAGIRSITPSTAFVGSVVTITGVGFGGPNVRVTVRGVPAPIVKVVEGAGNPTLVTFRVPVVPAGPTEVTVLNPGGRASSIGFLVMNHPPVANAGPDQTVALGSTVQLDGSASSDVDGDPLTYSWSMTTRPGGSAATLNGATSVRPTFVVDRAGTYIVTLRVNDGGSDSPADTVQIDTQNSPPVADAGPDQTVVHGHTVQLDGSASSDVDGDPLTFRWTLKSRPAGSDAALDDPSAARPRFIADLPGHYVAELIVNDGQADSRADTVDIDTTNSRPQADAGPDQTVTVGSTVALDGAGSADADGDPLSFTWSITTRPDGSAASLSDPAATQPTFLADRVGLYIVQLIVGDGAESSTPDTVVITVQPANQAPVVSAGSGQTITLPTDSVGLNGSVNDDGLPTGALTIAWSKVSGPGTVTFDTPSLPTTTAHFSTNGTYLLRLSASDGELSGSATVSITVNPAGPVNQPPIVDAGGDQTITLPAAASVTGGVTDDGLPGPPSVLTTVWSKVSGPGDVAFADPSAPVTTASFSTNGVYVLKLTANDGELTGSSQVTITVNAASNPGLPPDPKTVAPPLALAETTDFARGTEFLYTGANAIQTGVPPGAIEPRRAAVLRGRVLDRDGAALPGVAITILSHPEFGQTLSRADGGFDIAVNGGGTLTIAYAKAGFLPVQRAVDNTPWRDFAHVPDVMMTALDPIVTSVDLTSTVPIQVARGSVSTDADGSRQATVLFRQGTLATIVLPDGSTQPLARLSVRATEYTVGPNGPAAMPANLPPTSGYTYAVELSVDEALAAGATSVRFSQPVPVYVENFLKFPVGDLVPVGVYDREKGAWLAERNGRVIKILGVTGGLADLDVNGDDVADAGAALSDLGIDDTERAQLASLYATGTSLWRVALAHFTPWDFNWPFGLPGDARFPGEDPPPSNDTLSPPDPSHRCGSVIRCESRALGETIPLAGTPYRLHYASDRAANVSRSLDIPLTVKQTPPASLQRVDLTVQLAGRVFAASYAPAPGLIHTLVWDGYDAYGRLLQGEQRYEVMITYVYRVTYGRPSSGNFSFPLPSSQVSGENLARGEGYLAQRYAGTIGGFRNGPELGLGGWSVSQQHHFDPARQVLYLGTGEQQRASMIGRVVTTLFDQSGDIHATGTRIDGMATAPDGTVFFIDQGGCRVRMLKPDGTVAPFAGAGLGDTFCTGSTGDGIPAVDAQMRVFAIAVGPDGVYLADFITGGGRIRRVGRDGLIRTIAGVGGALVSTGDDGPALAADIVPNYIAVGPDGSVHVAESARIRRIGPDGIIHTIAGTGVSGTSGDGGPATQAMINPRGLALGPDGSLFFAHGSPSPLSVRRVTPDGVIRTIAGGLSSCSLNCGDGGPASTAGFRRIDDVAAGPDGSLYIVDQASLVRQIGPEGIINTVAGIRENTNSRAFFGDGRQATATQLFPTQVRVAPDNTLLVVSNGFHFDCSPCPAALAVHGIRRLTLPAVLTTTELAVPSQDGREIYVFTREGRHLRTLHAWTNAVLRQFGYDGAGRLTSITEATGGVENVTTIERSGESPTAIVGPFGQRTTLTTDSNGYLSAITNPAGETRPLVHDASGLLTQMVDARGGVHRFAYDGVGRLIRDEAPDGGAVTLTNSGGGRVSIVTLTTAEGRTTTYRTEQFASGDLRRVITDPSGAQTTILRQVNGTRTTTTPDGTVETIVDGPDPRWGLLVPVPTSQTLKLPSGLARTVTVTRDVTLSNPADLFTLATLDEAVTVNGRLTTHSFTTSTGTLLTTTPLGRQVTTTLDGLGRVTRRQLAALDPVFMAYDNRGRVEMIRQGGRATTFGFGLDGYLASITDAVGRTVRYARDPVGRVVSQTRSDGTVVAFAYDRNGNVTRLTPPGRPDHAFDYTPLDLAASYVAPGAVATGYSYNRDRQLVREARPDGKLVTLGYDAAGRRTSEVLDTGTIGSAYDTADRLTQLTAPGSLALAFGHDGFLTTTDTATGAVAGTVERAYDSSFRLASRSLNGSALGQTYDDDDLLTGTGSLVLDRDPLTGLVSITTLGVVTTALARNSFGEVMGVQTFASFNDVYTASYQRDDLGRLTSVVDIGGTEQYTYDAAGRLVQLIRNSVVAEQYEYDASGNRTRATLGASKTATYDDQDRLLTHGDATFTHTAAGERLTRTVGGLTTTYTYDALGNLIGATLPNGTQITYLVDGRSRRVGKRVNGVLVQAFVYQDQLRPIAELDGSGNVVSRFVYAQKINVPDYMIRGGVAFRIVSDHRGSPRLVVDATTGAIVQRMDYDGFGNVRQDTNPGFQPFGFAGGLYDRDTKLVRFGARDYDPDTGRWTAKDPMLFVGGDVNLYAYAAGDPVNVIDPNGQYLGFDRLTDAQAGEVLPAATAAAVGPSVAGWAAAESVSTTASSATFFYESGVVADVTITSTAYAGAQPAVGVLTGSLGSGIAASSALGVVAAGAAGYGVGTLIDMGITKALGESLGEALYDWLHPEENAPAYDPTRNRPRRCR